MNQLVLREYIRALLEKREILSDEDLNEENDDVQEFSSAGGGGIMGHMGTTSRKSQK